jgi:hypothetical protein
LLEATSSSTAEGEHKQESSKEDRWIIFAAPHPMRLILALFVALFIEIMAIAISSQLISQGQEIIPLSYLVGVMVAINDVILVGVIFVELAKYFRFVNADVKDKVFFGKIFMAGILLGLALEALTFTAVADGEHRNPWLNYSATTSQMVMVVVSFLFSQMEMVVASFQFAVLIGSYLFAIGLGVKRDSQTIYLHWSRFRSWLGFSLGLNLGVIMSMILAVANWGLQGGLTAPQHVSVLLGSQLKLASYLACTEANLVAVAILWTLKEAEDDAEDEENYSPA